MVAALLADLIDPVALSMVATAPTKVANAANPTHACALEPVSFHREPLRNDANPERMVTPIGTDSQGFAAVRGPDIDPELEAEHIPSQVSQHSQEYREDSDAAVTFDLPPAVMSDADMARFDDRRARLIRWGWAVPVAECTAERLANRDREQDERVTCTECGHYLPRRRDKPGRCGNHRRAGLSTHEIGTDLATLLQRCPGFRGTGAEVEGSHETGFRHSLGDWSLQERTCRPVIACRGANERVACRMTDK